MDVKTYLWRMVHFCQLVLILPLQLVYTAHMKRQLKPHFLPTTNNVTVHMGGLAVLQCQIEDLGPKTVFWRKGLEDFPLTIGRTTYTQDTGITVDHKELTESVTQWNLLIKNAKHKHAGLYECQISSIDDYAQQVQLHVINKPRAKPAINLTGTEYVDFARKIHLKCNASGGDHAPEDIDWFYEGQLIDTDDKKWKNRIEINNYRPQIPGKTLVSELTIDRSRQDDGGNYVCRSSELDTTSVKVHVLNAAGKEMNRRTVTKSEGQHDNSASNIYPTLCKYLVLVVVMLHALAR